MKLNRDHLLVVFTIVWMLALVLVLSIALAYVTSMKP